MKKEKTTKIIPVMPIAEMKPAPIITDPQGCYTGRPIEKHETPVQDADDL